MKPYVTLVLALGLVGVIANPVSKQAIKSENKYPHESSDSQTKHEEAINTSNKGDQEQKKDTPIESPKTPNIHTSNEVDGTLEIEIENTDFTADSTQIPENIDDTPVLPEMISSDLQPPIDMVDCLPVPQITGLDDSPSPQLPALESDLLDPELPNDLDNETLGQQLPEAFESGPPQLPGFHSGPLSLKLSGLPGLSGLFGGGLQLTGHFAGFPQTSEIMKDSPNLPEDLPVDVQESAPFAIQDDIMESLARFVPNPLVFKRKQKPRRRFSTRRHFRRNPYRRHQFVYPYRYYAFYRPSSLRYF